MGKRGRPRHPDILTPREWEVLALLREGLSNPEIAERLGVSRDTVKTHVSDILGKLGLASREEAAVWRREEHRPWWVGVPLLGGGVAARAATAVVAVAVLAGVGVLVWGLLRSNAGNGGSGEDGAIVVPIADLFTEPQPREADEVRSLGPARTTFDPWDGESTVLYDTATGEELTLGQGTFGRFSVDGRWMAWTAGPPYDFEQKEAWVIDLDTLEPRSLGRGTFLRFVEADTAAVQSAIGTTEVVDLHSGQRTIVESAPPAEQPPQLNVESFELRHVADDATPPYTRNTYNVVERTSGDVMFGFEALSADYAGPGELVVAAPPEGDWSNIFIVDVATGRATFIASGRLHYEKGQAFPLTANEQYVVWTDDGCAGGNTRIHHRDSGRLVEVDESLWAWLTDDGLIAAGAFGPHQLIDPESLERAVVVPDIAPGADVESSGPDVGWSEDGRYFSRGFAAGHGGYCI
ncbi:MAG: response regulator transcription factor [Dehalococcoidia bacterium]